MWIEKKFGTTYLTIGNLQLRFRPSMSNWWTKKYHCYDLGRISSQKGFVLSAYPFEVCYTSIGHKKIQPEATITSN